MNRQGSWLFETPSVQSSSYHTNSEYETLLENEWEISGDNAYTFPLTEEEWEVSRSRRPVSRSRRPIGRSPRTARRTARTPQRKPASPRRQQRHAPTAQRQLRQPAPSPQGQGQGQGTATDRILIATIDRFEFGSYLLKRHQFEQLQDLTILLIANKDLGTQVKLTFIGHTDNVGGEKAGNFHLAGRRAMEVENHIMRLFREKLPTFDLVSSIGGEGSQNPIAPNTTKDGQARNRRVEVFSDVPLKPAK